MSQLEVDRCQLSEQLATLSTTCEERQLQLAQLDGQRKDIENQSALAIKQKEEQLQKLTQEKFDEIQSMDRKLHELEMFKKEEIYAKEQIIKENKVQSEELVMQLTEQLTQKETRFKELSGKFEDMKCDSERLKTDSLSQLESLRIERNELKFKLAEQEKFSSIYLKSLNEQLEFHKSSSRTKEADLTALKDSHAQEMATKDKVIMEFNEKLQFLQETHQQEIDRCKTTLHQTESSSKMNIESLKEKVCL